MTVVATIAVQQRLRLFREGLGQLLEAEDDIDVVGTAANADELVALCHEQAPEVALLEADTTEWDPGRLIARLRRTLPKVCFIGITASETSAGDVTRARRVGMSTVVSQAGGIDGILAAIRSVSYRPQSVRLAAVRSCSSPIPTSALTLRELAILKLVGAGFTSREISGRLDISHKTVENHKQRIFAKLGVQNQAHAVSIAMRTGLLRPDRVIDLALAD